VATPDESQDIDLNTIIQNKTIIMTQVGDFIRKVESLAVIVEHKMVEAANASLPIMQKIEAAATSPEALVIESLIPGGATYAAEAIAAIKAAFPAIKLVAGLGDTSSTKGLLQRLGSQLTAIIHGGKHPFSWYVSCFEWVCFGVVDNSTPAAAEA